jgi:SAM-dependent methyltransferase
MDAAVYDLLWDIEQRHWWFLARRHIVWSLVARLLPEVSHRRLRICELGCGTGGNLAAVADRHDVIGVDSAPEAIQYARQRLGDRVQSGRLPDEINLPAASFDVVLMTDVLEHIEADVQSAQAALRLVRPGGILVATVPAYQWLYSPYDALHHHVRRYSKQRFRALWQMPDAKVLVLSYYNTLLFPAAAAVRLCGKIFPRGGQPRELTVPPGPVNRLLARMMMSEASLLERITLPFGLSLIAAVRRDGAVRADTGGTKAGASSRT